MPTTQSNNVARPPNRHFPARAIVIYWVTQIGLGLLISALDLENIHWLKDLLFPLDSALPTFRTAFVHSSTPIASKIYLALWWLIILPWGLLFAYRWSDGFKPHPKGLGMSYSALLCLLVVAIFMVYMLGSLLSYHDYSYYWITDKPNSPNRGDVVPALMTSGPLALSIWVAFSSFVFVVALVLVPYLFRVVLYKALVR